MCAEDFLRDTQAAPDYADLVIVAHLQAGLAANMPADWVGLPVAKKFAVFSLGADAGKELLADAQMDIAEIRRLLQQ